MSEYNVNASMAEQLQDLLISSEDTDRFLEGLALFSSRILGDSVIIHCGVTLVRHGKATTVASSGDEARQLDEIQYGFDEGPCLNAIDTQQTTVVADARSDNRWPDYFAAVQEYGYYSMLGVPLFIGGDGGAALNFYAKKPHTFTSDIVRKAETYAEQASRALQLAVRVAAHADKAQDLEATLRSRTSIDLAVGVIMAQNRCTQQEAFDILVQASSHQNVKLRVLADQLVEGISGEPAQTHFDS